MILDRFAAMGTQIEAYGVDNAALDEVHRLFAHVESVCSRFLPDSELSQINFLAGQAIEVSPLMGEVLEASAELRDRTGGLVDPGVGGRVVAWGYDRTFDEVGDRNESPAYGMPGGWRLDGTTLLLAEGTRLDLGGIAKGWTSDRAVERGLATMVSAGGDLRSVDPDLSVDVMSSSGVVLAEVKVGLGALASSSTARRAWNVERRRVSHLIDPRTGDPVRGPVVGATVTAATALEAEAGAKAVLMMGVDGLAWADEQSWIRSALVEWHDGSAFATGVAA